MTSPARLKKAVAFVNKHSGRVSSTDLHMLREEVHKPLIASGFEVDFVLDDCPALMEAAPKCHPDADYYIVIGGDGTIAALADIVTRLPGEHKPVFLPLPFGTANMFTRDLGFPVDPWEALEAALAAETTTVDIARVNGRAFLNNVVLGTFAEVAEARENFRVADNLHDKAMSLIESADALFYSSEHRYRVQMDNRSEEVSTNTIIVSNNAFHGSVDGVPHRDHLDAGMLAVYLTEAHDGFGFLARVAEAVMGGLSSSDSVDVRECKRCSIAPRDGEPIHYTVDGEILESEEPLIFEIVPGALRVPLMPAVEE
ncbi:diacylglycerol/lipid kinase family protein [Aquisalinus flavus]|uniref:Multidrug transporter n=1 Tax=Aquisalinus flavus TaxID=1526572 RepID=A0A8J2V6B0_9PROT|nr:diacylglycerol kinase family protein [Aquisalinus flavus]MBD0426091.1 hypothetical protein [Aquisalinus flavus]UNE48324.1 hypothetical protein FF099_09820 [Aquisalinus flavus]GGD10725.1 multidrug transporter [Aquisalinus flavus]